MAWNAGAIVGTAGLNTTQWTGAAKGMGASMAGAMGIAVGAIALVGVAFIKATKDSQEFLKAFSNVDTIVDETSVNMQQLAKDVLLLDPAFGNATEITNGLYMAFSAGAKDAEEAMDLTVTSAKFAKAGLTDMASSVDVLSTAINAYGKEQVDAQLAADIFFNTIKLGKVTGEELASTMGNSIPTFAALGVPLEQLAAGVATLSKQGINAAKATTQLNAVTNAFIKPSGAMITALQEQGYASGSMLLETEGLTGALEFLENQTGGNKEAIAELVPNIRGMKAVFALSGEGAEIYSDILAEMEDVTGSVDKAFEEQEKTLATAKNSFMNLSIVAGNLGNTFVNKIAVGASDAAQGMLKFITSSQGMEAVANFAYILSGGINTIKVILTPLVTGLFTAWKDILGNLFTNISELSGGGDNANRVFQFLGGTVKVLTTYLSVFAKFINTVVDALFDLIPMLIEGGKAVGYFLAGDYEKASEAGRAFLDNTKALGIGVKANMLDIGATVKEAFDSFGDDSAKVTQDVENAWKVQANGSKQFVLDNYDELLTGQSAFAQKMSKQREEQAQAFADKQEEVADKATEEGERGASSFSDAWTKSFEALNDFMEEGFSAGGFADTMSAVMSGVEQGMDMVNDALMDKYDQELDNVEAYYDKKLSIIEDYYENELAVSESMMSQTDADLFEQEIEALKNLQDQKLVTEDEYLLAQHELRETYNQQTIDSKKELETVMTNTALSSEEKQMFAQAYYANASASIEEQKEAELLRVKDEAQEAKNKIERKAFEAEKAQRISSVWIDAFSAQMGYASWASGLGPWAWIAAAAMGTATLINAGVQTGMIVGEQYTPSYNKGTGNHPGGLARVGDDAFGNGGEIVNMPAGSQVVPSVKSDELMDTMKRLADYNNTGAKVVNNFDFTNADLGGMSEEEISELFEEHLNETLKEVVRV